MKRFKLILDKIVEAENGVLAVQVAINDIQVIELDGVIDIYTDGSFTDAGCFGGFIAYKGDEEIYRHSVEVYEEKYLPARNVAGELVAAMIATQWAKRHQHYDLVIHHDYEGVAKWITGEWGAKKPVTRDYKAFIDKMAKFGVKVKFEWVRGHNGDPKNEAIDNYISSVSGRRT